MSDRSQFLSFCTALPRVPLKGLPQIKVFPPVPSRVTALVLSDKHDPDDADEDDEDAGGGRTVQSFAVGDTVRLAPGYANIEDAAVGPLQPGDEGVVTSVISRVRVRDWWYSPAALRKVTAVGSGSGSASASAAGGCGRGSGVGSSPREGAAAAARRRRRRSGDGEGDEAEVEGEEGEGEEGDGDAVEDEEEATRRVVAKMSWFSPGDVVALRHDDSVRAVVQRWDASTNTLYLTDAASNREFRPGKSVVCVERAEREDGGGEGEEEGEGEGEDDADAWFAVHSVVERPEVVQCAPFLRPKATTCVHTLYLPTGYDSAEHMLEVFRAAFQDAKLGGIADH